MRTRSAIASALLALIWLLQNHAFAQGSVDDYMQAVEGAQQQSNEGLGNLTIEELMEELEVPGLSIAIIKDFNIHWAKAYGLADSTTGARADIDTKFQAASISKVLNAIALLKAEEDGLIDIDEDINEYLKTWKIPRNEFTLAQPVTARMLASHTSGLGDGLGFPGYAPEDRIPTLSEILNGESPANTGAVRMARAPATAYHYSGGGVTIIQLALVDMYGKSYGEILNQNVLIPLEMHNSTFEQPLSAANDKNAARAHPRAVGEYPHKWKIYPELAAAGLWTTPSDLAKVLIDTQRAYRRDTSRVLTTDSVQKMLSPVGVGPYAVGYTIAKNGEGWYFGHGGSNFGFLSSMEAHKSKGYGYVIMTNSSLGRPLIAEISRRIKLAYFWDSLDQPIRR